MLSVVRSNVRSLNYSASKLKTYGVQWQQNVLLPVVLLLNAKKCEIAKISPADSQVKFENGLAVFRNLFQLVEIFAVLPAKFPTNCSIRGMTVMRNQRLFRRHSPTLRSRSAPASDDDLNIAFAVGTLLYYKLYRANYKVLQLQMLICVCTHAHFGRRLRINLISSEVDLIHALLTRYTETHLNCCCKRRRS